MPALIGMYEDHFDDRGDFEIIAIHDSTVKSLAELDKKTARIQTKFWGGKKLPFTVLLDLDSQTEKTYGVDAHPTSILIGPDGNVVGHISLKTFEEKLTPLPASALLARARDQTFNVAWHLDSKVKVSDLASYLSKRIGCEIQLDTKGLDDAGYSGDSPLPIAVAATGHSIRGLELLILEPLGLELRANELDPSRLSLTKISNPEGRESFAESDDLRRRDAEISKFFDLQMDKGPGKKETSNDRTIIEIEGKSLFQTIVLIENEFGVPIAVDTSSLLDSSIPADLKINGTLDTNQKLDSLARLLEKHNLRGIVKFGVLLLVPIKKAGTSPFAG